MAGSDRMQDLADSATLLVWMTDADGICIFLNQDRLFPRTDWAAFSDAAWSRCIHPDDRAHVLALRADALASRLEYQVEYRLLRSDGATRWIMHCGAPRFAVDGRFDGYNGTMVDVSQRHELLERFRSLTDLSSDWYWETDTQDRFTFMSEGLGRLFGTDPLEVIGKTRSERAPDPNSPELLAYLDHVSRREGFKDLPYSAYVASRGAIRHAVISGEPVFDAGVFKGYRGTGRDVTQEIELARRLAALSEENWTIVESSLDLLVTLDADGRYLRVNGAVRDILGYAPEELLGRHYSDFLAPDDLEKRVSVEKFLRAGAHKIADIETRWMRKDGKSVYLSSSVRWSESRQVMYAAGRDITKRRLAEDALRASERRLRNMIALTPAGYLLTDARGLIQEVNPAFCHITGYAADDLIGIDVMTLLLECPIGGALFQQGGVSSVHGKESAVMRKDGSRCTVLINVAIERDAAGDALMLTAFVTDITERKSSEARLEQLATHDSLTGLPNRALVNSHLQGMLAAARPGHSVALMFIDLDRFKEVNDSLGHVSGDALLQLAARRLKNVMRPQDMIARLGGDEFVAAAPCAAGNDLSGTELCASASAAVIAERLLAALAAPFSIGSQEVFISASIGISMYPQDGATKEALFQNADIAMYRAKANGRNGFCFFEARMSTAAKTRLTIENALHRALERAEFVLHYQPRIDLQTMMITGMEALIRWHHPQLGLVPPLEFIPIAEECGLIEAIGRWVLLEACTQSRRLTQQYGIALHVSVNVAARQLKCADFPAQVLAALDASGLDPHALELELTESALIENVDTSAAMLHSLRALGIRISVDDFGTGYSGLSYLRRFPLDILKLDRSFLSHESAGVQSESFIKAFVDMAHALNLWVVAEGVEDVATCDFLRAADCDEAQGYLFSKPLSLADFERYLAQLQTQAPSGRLR
jgi:diguanylate cyclase (GGDEF)-like protein/PAS domain S-box-containing protein